MCLRAGLALVALLRICMLHRQVMLLCLLLRMRLLLGLLLLLLLLLGLLLGLSLLLLLLLLLLHECLVLLLVLLHLRLLLLPCLHLLLEMSRQLHRINLLLVVLEGLLILVLLSRQYLLQLLRVHLLHLLGRNAHGLCLCYHPLAHHVLLLRHLSHHLWIGVLLKLLLLLLMLHDLLLLLLSHMAERLHATLRAGHVLASHAVTGHAHRGARVLTSHTSSSTRLHASHSTRLHSHHCAGLGNVRWARHAMHLHRLAHVLVRRGSHTRVTVGKTRVHIVSRRVCRHHFAVASYVGRLVLGVFCRSVLDGWDQLGEVGE